MHYIRNLFRSISFILAVVCCIPLASTVVSDSAVCRSTNVVSDDVYYQTVLNDIESALSDGTLISDGDMIVPRGLDDVNAAIHDSSPSKELVGQTAWKFLRGLANSRTFVNEYWHKRPLLIRAPGTGGWVEDFFTIDRDLR
jgi:hypothetical protein